MLSYIFSAVLGVFAEKLISFTNKKDRTIVAIVLVFFLTFSSLFYWSLGKMTEPPAHFILWAITKIGVTLLLHIFWTLSS